MTCDVCHRTHQGRCTPPDKRTGHLCATLPGHVLERLRERVPYRERSAFVEAAITAALDAEQREGVMP